MDSLSSDSAPTDGARTIASAPSRPPIAPLPHSLPSRLARLTATLQRPPLWLTLAVCIALLAARRPDALTRPQLWAEDGIFFHQAYTLGDRALFEELAGYFHLVPRLVATLSVWFDPRWVPHIFVGSAFLGILYVASRLCSPRCLLPLPGACALALVLVPDAGEVLLTVANLQWVLAGGLILLLLSADPQSPTEKIHDALAAVVIGFTGPFSIALAPLFCLRAWTRRTVPSVVLAALVTLCGVVQLVSIIRHPLPVPAQPTVDLGALASIPGIRVGSSLFLGVLLPKNLPVASASFLTVLTLGAIVFLALKSGPVRRERLWLALALAALLASSLVRYRYSLPALCTPGNGSRYFFAVQLVALWLLLSTASGHRSARLVAAVALTMLFANLPRLREGPFTDYHWENYVSAIRAGQPVTIPINPGGWPINLPARSSPK